MDAQLCGDEGFTLRMNLRKFDDVLARMTNFGDFIIDDRPPDRFWFDTDLVGRTSSTWFKNTKAKAFFRCG